MGLADGVAGHSGSNPPPQRRRHNDQPQEVPIPYSLAPAPRLHSVPWGVLDWDQVTLLVGRHYHPDYAQAATAAYWQAKLGFKLRPRVQEANTPHRIPTQPQEQGYLDGSPHGGPQPAPQPHLHSAPADYS